MKMPTRLEVVKCLIESHGELSPSEAIILETAYNFIATTIAAEVNIVDPNYRHYKGGYYVRKQNARLSISSSYPLQEGTELAIYVDTKGRWHARHIDEFLYDVLMTTEGTVPRFTLVREGNIDAIVPPPSPLDANEWREQAGMDGAKWAAEFRSIAYNLGYGVMDESWLIGWFANAIMAGYDHGVAQRIVESRPHFGTTPPGFEWMGVPVRVRGGDYVYEGECLLSFPKPGEDMQVRYIVMDQNRRLFIHGEHQIEWLDADPEERDQPELALGPGGMLELKT